MKYRLFYLVVLFLILVFGFQNASGDSLVSKGPKDSLACDGGACDVNVIIGDLTDLRPTEGIINIGDLTDLRPTEQIPATPVQPAAPEQPVSQPAPAPSCGEYEFKYNECYACNKSRRVEQNSCGNYKTSDNPDADSACASWCPAAPAQPAPQPAPAAPAAPQGGGQACQPGGWSAVSCSVCNAEGTGMNRDGSDWGTYDGEWGSWCGCAQKFGNGFNKNNYPQCGSATPVASAPVAATPVQQAPAPQQPAPVQTAAVQLPQCNTLANNLVCGQKAYDTCREFTQNGIKYFDCVASQNHNCTGIIQCSAPTVQAPAPAVVVPPVINENRNTNQQQQSQSVQQNVQQNNTQVVNIPAGNVAPVVRVVERVVEGVTVRNAVQDCPSGTVKKVVNQQIVCEVTRSPVIVSGTGLAKELPKTGLPAVAWAISAVAPMGISLKKFRKGLSGDLSSSANYVWQLRQFKKAN